MTVSDALLAHGVHNDTLSIAEKEQLDTEGFLSLPGILSFAQIAQITARLDALLSAERARAGIEAHQEVGTERLSDLVNKGTEFDVFTTHPRVLAGLAHVLQNDLKLSSLNARFALPGEGLQSLHADWGRLETPGDWQVCNSIWLLDDFTLDNGATRVVPKSHHKGSTLPSDEMADPADPHPAEQKLIAPAGTVVIFNSHTWHGGTLNTTSARRRAIHSYWTRRSQPQQTDQQAFLRPETQARLSAAHRCLLGV